MINVWYAAFVNFTITKLLLKTSTHFKKGMNWQTKIYYACSTQAQQAKSHRTKLFAHALQRNREHPGHHLHSQTVYTNKLVGFIVCFDGLCFNNDIPIPY